MTQPKKFQFSLKHLLIAIVVFSLLTSAVIYLYEPHLVEGGRYQITVDYSRTLQEMIAAGKYDWINPDITAVNFPIDPAKSGTEQLEAIIVHLDKDLNGTEALLKLINRKGWRLATLPELLALGEKYPELQEQCAIFALSSRHQIGGRWYFAYLARLRDDERMLHIFPWSPWESQWYRYCNFLVFRK